MSDATGLAVDRAAAGVADRDGRAGRDRVTSPPVLLRHWVPGDPVPKGSMRAFLARGHVRMIPDNRPAAARWHKQLLAQLTPRATRLGEPIDGPVKIDLEFWLPRPRSHYRTGREDRQLRAAAPRLPHLKPGGGLPGGDLDKLTRAVWDALVDANVLTDDSRVCRSELSKAYVTPWVELAPDWQRRPGVVITVVPL